MIKEAYVSFEVAKLLKEKGFNEPCRSYYTDYEDYIDFSYCNDELTDLQMGVWETLRPTHQMAMKWLREKSVIIVIQPEYFNIESKCSTWGVDIWADDNYEKLQGDYPKYEEAVEAALKYVLENLI